jgi:hypothetical protein
LRTSECRRPDHAHQAQQSTHLEPDRPPAASLNAAFQEPGDTAPPAGAATATGHWLYSAKTGEIGRLELQAHPRGRLDGSARACVEPFLSPTP